MTTPTLLEWQRKHGITAEALADLVTMVGLDVEPSNDATGEHKVQDDARLLASKKGWRLFRNNKGVLPDKRGVPVVAIALSGLMTLICVVINYLIPGKAFQLLMALVVAALVINWAMISLTHIKFRHAMNAQKMVPAFKAFWFPLANYLCLVFLAGMLVILYLLDEKISVYLVPVWLVLLWAGYQYKRYIGKQQRSLGGVAKVVAE